MIDYLGKIGIDFDLDLEINNQNLLRPGISIDHVQNLFIDGEPDTITRRTFPRVDDFSFVSWKSKSKRRSFKKKLKKIVREANKLYQGMQQEEDQERESLEEEMFEDRMY